MCVCVCVTCDGGEHLCLRWRGDAPPQVQPGVPQLLLDVLELETPLASEGAREGRSEEGGEGTRD